MTMPSGRPTRRSLLRVSAAVLAGATLLAGSGCSGESADDSTAPARVDMAAELAKPAELTFWTWVDGIDKEVALFEKKYPNIKVNVVNAGQGPAQYTKLRTALKAGTGAPDVVQVEYQYVPTFTITKDLLDLAPYGANDIKDQFVDWTWSQVSRGDKVYAIPQDTGPMGMLYRRDIFEKYKIEVPKTWDEFAEAARKLHAADPKVYLTNFLANDGGFVTGMAWQAGSRPFAVEGDKVSVSLNDPGMKKLTGYWEPLLKEGVISTDPGFTDQFYQGLSSGKYATWLTAAWGPLFLQGTAKNTSGKWAAAPLPQWNAGENVSGNWGGSTSAVTAKTKYPAAAAALAKFLNSDPESTKMLATQQFLFPATKAALNDPAVAGQKPEFYGGQEVNKLFAGISDTVPLDYQFSPFQDYVYTAMGDTLGKAMSQKGDLTPALDAWQKSVTDYATKQGFTVQAG
ncbi:ABC transporter substrate-binding protein [Micromonospora sp. BQ11]|uniref:ABC transporter substrate-binding protein n=1 Tax=Micromonospora sp. BQ11 TaxID=3452212 RepID=UPI003F88A279